MEWKSLPLEIREQVDQAGLKGYLVGRVIEEHRERYILQDEDRRYSAEITGNLRYSATDRLGFPAVGDWVKALPSDENTAIILEILPRFSILERQAIGQHAGRQIIATNLNGAFIVQSPGQDFNMNRLERYLTICHNSGIRPFVVLTKTDLLVNEELNDYIRQIEERVSQVPVIAVSNLTGQGYAELLSFMHPGNTYCFLGSSGVGKSSLVNGLAGKELLRTSDISHSTAKGRHTTSHRELVILPNGSIVIDTPGMRELGLTDQEDGLEQTYDQIHMLARECRFSDCSHISEAGCAVLEALENGTLDAGAYENYQKLQREQERFSTSLREKRAKSRKQGKLYKSILQDKTRRKFGGE